MIRSNVTSHNGVLFPHTAYSFVAMMSSLDDLVGKVVQDLKDTNMYENTIILFSSDV